MTLIDRSTVIYNVVLRVLDEMYGVSKSYHDAIDEAAATDENLIGRRTNLR